MNEYIELLTKIKDTMIQPAIIDDIFNTFKNITVVGVSMIAIGFIMFMILCNMSKVSKFLDIVKVVSAMTFIVGMIVSLTIVGSMVLSLALIPNGLSKESKVSISNYVVEMNDQEYSRLEKLVKLYGNQLSSEDRTIKQINKHLVETVGK